MLREERGIVNSSHKNQRESCRKPWRTAFWGGSPRIDAASPCAAALAADHAASCSLTRTSVVQAVGAASGIAIRN